MRYGHRCVRGVLGTVFVGAAAYLAATSGCALEPLPTVGIAASADLDVVTVVGTVYELEGADRGVLFVVADGYNQPALEVAARQLAEQLSVEVLPGDMADMSSYDLPALTPAHPETGEAGIVVRVFAIEQVAPGEARARVMYSRSGLDGGTLELTFERVADGWELTGQTRTGVA